MSQAIAAVIFVLLLSSGLWLLIRNPQMPPPSPEMQEFTRAMNELSRVVGEAFVPPLQRMAGVLSRMLEVAEPVIPMIYPPSDPNPFPRIKLRRGR